METLATKTSALTDAKRLLLRKMLNGADGLDRRDSATSSVVTRSGADHPPISPEQLDIWLHAAMASDVPLYNESITIHHNGKFDRAAMERAFNEILRRHEAWRTSFASLDGQIVQVIHPKLVVSLPVTDLSGMHVDQREQEMLRIATEQARKPIDLGSSPLFRINGFRLAEDEHRLYLTLHHLIFDGVSIYRVIVPELSRIYHALMSGREPQLPAPAVQYSDYTVWRHRQARTKAVRDQLGYWRRTLAGPLPVLQLPTDRPRPLRLSFRGGMETFALPAQLTQALKVLSRTEGVTLYMMLLAAFKALLHRYSGQDDIIVGGATDTRRRPELQQVVGYFLNPLALRTRPGGDLTFRSYLMQTRDAVAGALDASDIPFERIVRELAPPRNSGAHPLFQVLFSMEPPAPAFEHGFDLTQMDVDGGVAKFDLYLELDERPEGLIGRFFYSSDLFDPATIRRMIGHWRTILEAIVEDPACTLGELPLMTGAERRQSLIEWNETGADVPDLMVHQLIEMQARQTPDAIAVECFERSSTYAELDRRAEAFAGRLRTCGIGRGDLVAVAIDRSIDLVAALLGVLKAGAAYLPLDPQFPKERLQLILDEAKPRALITQHDLLAGLPTTDAVTILCDDLAASETQAPRDHSNISPEDLAYVIYTSGSTGKPKGVEIPHAALVNLLASMQRETRFTDADRLLAVTTVSFDIAGLELFLPLIAGARLILAPSKIAADPALLREFIGHSRCTIMQATPAAWRALVETDWRGSPALKILCGGEALSRELADRLRARCGRLWNVYGPTETTIWSTIHEVDPTEGPVPIGRPLANTTTFIVDQRGNPVPVGLTGELLIGGRGVACGYRNRPRLTEEKFIVSPLAPDGRLYRTGDYARYRTDGSIECLGRVDNQVKVRGFRVEPEAVETFLLKHRNVAGAAVKAVPDASGEKSLVAYIVSRDAEAPSATELRQFLQQILPDHMVPSRYVAMRELPMTPNRKIDRNALPEPKELEQPAQLEPPRTDIERRLAKIWKDVLRIKVVNARDNFLDLGGHSLLVAKLLRRIELEFGRSLSMSSVFYAPQLDQLAEVLEGTRTAALRIVPVQPRGSRPPIFWMGGGGEITPLIDALGSDQPFFDVVLEFPDRAETVRFQDLAADVVRTLRTRPLNGPLVIGGYCSRGTLAYEVAAQLRALGETVQLVILLDSMNPVQFHERRKRRVDLLGRLNVLKYHGSELAKLRGANRRRHGRMLLATALQRFGLDFAQPEMSAAERVIEASALDYKPPPYDGTVALFQAKRRPPGLDHRAGWRTPVQGTLDAYEVTGNHDDFIQQPHVAELAKLIASSLARVRRKSRQQDDQFEVAV